MEDRLEVLKVFGGNRENDRGCVKFRYELEAAQGLCAAPLKEHRCPMGPRIASPVIDRKGDGARALSASPDGTGRRSHWRYRTSRRAGGAIRAAHRALHDAYDADVVDKEVAFCADDAGVMEPGSPAASGHDAIRQLSLKDVAKAGET